MMHRLGCRCADLILFLMFAVVVAACAGPQRQKVPSAQPPSTTAPVDRVQSRGDRARATELEIEETEARVPEERESQSPTAQALKRAAELQPLFDRQRAAHRHFELRQTALQMVNEAPLTPQAHAARLLLARDAAKRSDWPDVVRWLEPLLEREDPAIEGLRLLAQGYDRAKRWSDASLVWSALLEHAQSRTAKHLAASTMLDFALRAGGEEPIMQAVARLKDRYANPVALLQRGYDTERVAVLRRALGESPQQVPELALLRARHHCLRAGDERCEPSASAALTSPDPETVEEAQRLLETFRSLQDVKTKTLGVLLPLSGTYQSHGQSALEAIQVALQGKDVILKVRDTAGTPEQAQAAAQALIMKEGVVALVGPIGLRESRAALEVSAAFGVAHAVLANRPELTEGIETAVRLGVSQSEEAAGLAKHAWIEMGIKRIAILGPRGQHEPTAFAFWDAFVRLGGEVRGVELYDKDLKDLKEVISRLLVIRDDGRLEPDFEALFIPAGPKALKRLLGYLSFHQIDPRRAPNERAKAKRFLVQLLGPHAWNTRSTIHTQRLTDNAVFTDGFSDHESLSIAHRFSEVFRKRYRRGPSAFEARVHDTMTLFVQCLGEIGGTDRSRREQFLERLYAARHLEGTTGTISVIKDVGVLLKPRILTLDGKEIRPRLSEDEETVLRR